MSHEADHTSPHPASDHEAPNGEGTATTSASGETLDHPVRDGSTEDYGQAGSEQNPRHGEDDPALIRHPGTGKTTPTPEHF